MLTPALELLIRDEVLRLLNEPPTGAFSVTPSDTVDLTHKIRAFEVTVGGAVTVTFEDGSTIALPARVAGTRYSGIITRIWATGTTATGIIAYR